MLGSRWLSRHVALDKLTILLRSTRGSRSDVAVRGDHHHLTSLSNLTTADSTTEMAQRRARLSTTASTTARMITHSSKSVCPGVSLLDTLVDATTASLLHLDYSRAKPTSLHARARDQRHFRPSATRASEPLYCGEATNWTAIKCEG